MRSPWRKETFTISIEGERRRWSVTGWVHVAGYGVDKRAGVWLVTHLATGMRVDCKWRLLRDAKAAVEVIVRVVPELAPLTRPPATLGRRVKAALKETNQS